MPAQLMRREHHRVVQHVSHTPGGMLVSKPGPFSHLHRAFVLQENYLMRAPFQHPLMDESKICMAVDIAAQAPRQVLTKVSRLTQLKG